MHGRNILLFLTGGKTTGPGKLCIEHRIIRTFITYNKHWSDSHNINLISLIIYLSIIQNKCDYVKIIAAFHHLCPYN